MKKLIAEQTINFMYFANNFTHDQIKDAIDQTSAPDHLFNKLKAIDSSIGVGNGTQAFFKWFMELSQDNQIAICNWVSENYSAFGNITKESKTMLIRGTVLKGKESEARLIYLLGHEGEWNNPEHQVKGIHEEQQMFIVWDNTTGHCNVENFKKERNAIAWLNDEEV